MGLVRRTRKNVTVNMQRTRLKLLQDLESMFDMAKAHATNEKTKDKQRQIWLRIMAYIAQVMNSLSKTFDEATVTRDLEELEKMINEAMAKGKDKGA
jgi:ArsR family metal-binding transcriptional regulator